jgi:aminopeptidase
VSRGNDYARRLAELVVRFGANVQPGQIVALSSEPGKEPLARAVAEAAYKAGARFVDLSVFDVHLKRARALYADPETLTFVPPWYGRRVHELGRCRAARIGLTGPVAPRIMDGIDPALAAKDRLPSLRESVALLNERTTNWSLVPCPTPDWAELVYPELEPDAALERLWDQIAHVCRLDEPDPVAAWRARLDRLMEVATKLNRLQLDRLRFNGPGTDLTVGLLPGSRWIGAELKTDRGVVHIPNIPTEEVFTVPDPERVEGTVRATKPLFISGRLLTGFEIEFERGRAVKFTGDNGVEPLRSLARRDPGAGRLGEIALVDAESRVGGLATVFYDTLLDENAASHIALGHAFAFAVMANDAAHINESEIHVDFMIGSDEVTVTGITASGRELTVLLGGAWQL